MNYEKFIKINEKAISMNEMALSNMQISKIERLVNAGDLKESLKLIQINLNGIIEEILNLGHKNIESVIEKNKNIDYVEIIYSKLIKHELDLLRQQILENDFLTDEIFKDGNKNFIIEIDIHKNLFNKIDINIGLPYIFRNNGIGILIYKHLIFKYNYISSLFGYKPSIYSDMVWHKLAKDDNLYFFSSEDNFLVINKTIKKENIYNTISQFYQNCDKNSNYELDSNFEKDHNDLFLDIKSHLETIKNN